jgi:hypothetical protein
MESLCQIIAPFGQCWNTLLRTQIELRPSLCKYRGVVMQKLPVFMDPSGLLRVWGKDLTSITFAIAFDFLACTL